MQVNSSPTASTWRFLILLPVLCCLSCSSSASLYPVKGKLLYKGEPVAGAVITFHPRGADVKTVRPVGLTDEDGTFTVTTGEREGAPAGQYVVTIICAQPVKPAGKKTFSLGDKPESVDRFNGAYAKESTSKLTVEIKAGNNQLEPFNLK